MVASGEHSWKICEEGGLSTQANAYHGKQIGGPHQRQRTLISDHCRDYRSWKRRLCLWKSCCRRDPMLMGQTGELIRYRCNQEDQNRDQQENGYRFSHQFHFFMGR